MKILSQDLMSAYKYSQSSNLHYVRFAVDGYFLDDDKNKQTDGVTITITATGFTQHDNYIDVPLGTKVAYTVEKDDYEPVGPKYCTVTGPSVIPVELSDLPQYQFNIVATPSDSTITQQCGTNISTTGSITVPQGSLVAYTVARSGMDSYTGSRMIPISETEPSPISIDVVLDSTITIRSIKCDGEDVEGARITWTGGTGDPTSGLSKTASCTETVTLHIEKDGYDDVDMTFSANPYRLGRELDIVLTKTVYTCAINVNLGPVTITMWKEVNGERVDEVHNDPNMTTCSIQGVVGDDIHWLIEKQYYNPVSGNYVINPETFNANWPKSFNLVQSDYVVAISTQPANADITILDNSTIIQTGTGVANASVHAGTYITYRASLGGVTVERYATITDNFQDEIVLDATVGAAVTKIDTTQTVNLPYGYYKFIIIGAGGGGNATVNPAVRTDRSGYYGSNGGGGGGSGYVKIKYLMIDNKNGQDVVFNVGNGGTSAQDGGSSSVISGLTTFIAEGGKHGYSTDTLSWHGFGGDGGCGGGGGSIAEHKQPGTGLPTVRHQVAAGKGANAGGNGEASVTASSWGHDLVNNYGGTGFYNVVKSYENNRGNNTTSLTYGGPGGGGKGLISINSSILSALDFSSLTDVQVLYNAMAGGGGGGSTGCPTTEPSVTVYGGPGGGGGGWDNGSAGTVGSGGTAGTGGTGGKGAILYMRVGWSGTTSDE